jgi:acetolactate synthase I/II/III large subunit
MPLMSGAKALVKILINEGIDVAFGIPGVQTMDVLDEIYRSRKIRWISPRHEQTAAYMAYGYALSTGKTGTAIVLPGPGALNTAAAVGTAYSASAPVLIISGQIESQHLGYHRGVLHELDDQDQIFRRLTKYSARAERPEDIPDILCRALRELKTGCPRPVEIEVPYDFWAKKGEMVFSGTEKAPPTPPDMADIEKSVEILKKARRPMILAGRGAVKSGISKEVVQLAENLKAPVVMTPEGQGLVPTDHPFYGGNSALWKNPIFKQADAILVIGARLRAAGNTVFHLESDQRVIQIDCNSGELRRNFLTGLEISKDTRLTMQAIIEKLGNHTSSQWLPKDIAARRNELRRILQKAGPFQMSVIDTLYKVLGDESILVPDITNIGYWCDLAYPVNHIHTYIEISYFGTLGLAFPTALGAKVGNPNRNVVAVCGDGGFPYASAELATAVQEKLNVVTIIFSNNAYGTVTAMQRDQFGGRYIGNTLHNPDYVKFAESFGALGFRTTVEDLGKTLQKALSANRPAIIEVPVPLLDTPWETEVTQP